MAKFVWRSLHVTFNISPPNSINGFLGRGYRGLMFKSLNSFVSDHVHYFGLYGIARMT